MPGNTNSGNILEAANQIVAAINDLMTEIQNVQITINNQMGSGGGGCGCCDDDEGLGGSTIQNDGGGEPYYGSEPPAIENRSNDPPDGFDTWAEYDQNKCNVAAAIVSGLAIWFRRSSQIQDVSFVTGSIVLGLAAGTVLTFPPALIALVVGALVLLYVESMAFSEIADDIEANADELQCGIYNALSSTVAIDFVRGRLDVYAENRFSASVVWVVKKLITLVVTIDTVNKAFVDKIGQVLPTADCSGCRTCPRITVAFGDLVQGTLDDDNSLIFPQTIIINTKQDTNGYYYATLIVDYSGCSCQTFRIRPISFSQTAALSSHTGTSWRDCGGQYSYINEDFPDSMGQIIDIENGGIIDSQSGGYIEVELIGWTP